MKNLTLKICGMLFLMTAAYSEIYAQSVSFNWATATGGTGQEFVSATTTDADGNVYVTGTFAGTVDFDPSSSTLNLTSAGDLDIFILKISASGTLVWAKSIGGSLTDKSHDLCLDNNGNIIITGGFRGVADFNPGTTEDTMWSSPQIFSNGTYSYSYPDLFVLKLNNSGEYVWSKRVGIGYADYGAAVQCDAANNIIVGGNWDNLNRNVIPNEDTLDADPGPGFYWITGGGAIIIKLTSSGDFMWAKNYGTKTCGCAAVLYDTWWYAGTTSTFRIKDLTSDALGNLYIALKRDDYGAAIAKIDSSGNVLKIKYLSRVGNNPNVSQVYIASIHLDQNANILLGGYFVNSIDFDPSTSTSTLNSTGYQSNNPLLDGFIAKYNDTGKFIWVAQLGTNGDDRVNDAKFDQSGDVYATGLFTGKVDFNPASGSRNTYYLTSKGSSDAFLLKYSSAGAFQLANQTGGKSADAGEKLALSNGEDIVVHSAGTFSGTADLNPTSGTFNETSAGGNDFFVQKLTLSGSVPFELEAPEEPELKLRIYPNPVNSELRIVVPKEAAEILYDLFDINGKNVKNGKLSYWEQTIDFSNLTSGIYQLRLVGTNSIQVFRLKKE